jgi:hypothetical protein
LEQNIEALRSQGVGVAAISYDSSAALSSIRASISLRR